MSTVSGFMDFIKKYRFIIGILLLAIALRIGAGIFYYFNDSLLYVKLAGALESGKLYLENFWNISMLDGKVFLPPVYPLLIAGVHVLVPNIYISAMLVSLLSSCASLLLIYGIGTRLFDERTGRMAVVVAAIFPMHIAFSLFIMTEPAYLFFILLAVYVFLRFYQARPSWLHAGCVGLIVGIAFLTRSAGIAFLGLFIMFIVWHDVRKKIAPVRIAISVAALIGCFIIIVLPFNLYIHHYSGAWVLSSQQGSTLQSSGIAQTGKIINGSEEDLRTYYQQLMGLSDDSTAYQYEAGQDQTSVGERIQRYIMNVLDYALMALVIYLPLGAVALLHKKNKDRQERYQLGVLALCIVGQIAVLAFGRSNLRYLFGCIPFFLIAFSYLYYRSRLVGNKLGVFFLMSLAIVYWWGVSLVFNEGLINFGKAYQAESYPEGNPLVQRVVTHLGQGDSIASFSPLYAYQSDRPWYRLPYGTVEEVHEYAVTHKIKYIVLDPSNLKYYGDQSMSAVSGDQCWYGAGFGFIDGATVLWPKPDGSLEDISCGLAVFSVK